MCCVVSFLGTERTPAKESSEEKNHTRIGPKNQFHVILIGVAGVIVLSLTNSNRIFFVTKNAMRSLQCTIHGVQTEETMHRVQVRHRYLT